MRAGLLRESIKILVPVTRKNEVGELVTDYVDNCEIKARVIYGRGSRDIENIGEVVHNKAQIFEVRHYQKVDDFDHIEWNGKQYRITDITVDNQSQKKIITVDKIND